PLREEAVVRPPLSLGLVVARGEVGQRAPRDDTEFAAGDVAAFCRLDQPPRHEFAAGVVAAMRQFPAGLLQDHVQLGPGTLTQRAHATPTRLREVRTRSGVPRRPDLANQQPLGQLPAQTLMPWHRGSRNPGNYGRGAGMCNWQVWRQVAHRSRTQKSHAVHLHPRAGRLLPPAAPYAGGIQSGEGASAPKMINNSASSSPAPQKIRIGRRFSTSMSMPVVRDRTLAMAAISDLVRVDTCPWIAEPGFRRCEPAHAPAYLAAC